jgi:filamentous hemagglutinin family protein
MLRIGYGKFGLRSRLLCWSALATTSVAATLAMPRPAAALDNKNVTYTTYCQAITPCVTTNGDVTTVNATSSVDGVVRWNSFDLTGAQTLNFDFGDHNNAIALNIVDANTAAKIYGHMDGCLNAACTQYGGNIWIYDSAGVIFGNGAVVNTGGLLATTSPLQTLPDGQKYSDAGFSKLNQKAINSGAFAFGPSPNSNITIDAGATIHGNHGTLAFVAPNVDAGGNVDGAANVLYGAGNSYQVKFLDDGSNMDLVSFEVTAASTGTGAAGCGGNAQICVSGTTNVKSDGTTINHKGSPSFGNVQVMAVSQSSVADGVIVSGTIEATNAQSTNAGDIELSSTGSGISVSGDVTANGASGQGGQLNVKSDGAVTQSAGTLSGEGVAIDADTGDAVTGTGVELDGSINAGAQGFDVNANGSAVALNNATLSSAANGKIAGAGITQNGGAISVADALTLNSRATVDSQGDAILQEGGGVIDAGALQGFALGNVSLTSADNQIANLGGSLGFRAGGNTITLNDDVSGFGQLTINGAVTAGTLDVAVTSGGINETSSGLINAGLLEGTAQGAVSLGSSTTAIANKIGDLGGTLGFDTDGFGFSLTDARNLDIDGALTTDGKSIFLQTTNAGKIEIGAGGSLSTLNAGTGALGDLTLESAGAIEQETGAGAITANTLEGNANGAVILTNSANQIADLGGKLGFNAAGHTVDLVDDVTSSGQLTIDGTISAGTLDLTVANGGIKETSTGQIDVGVIEGSAQGGVTLGSSTAAIGNQINDLGGALGFDTGGNAFSLTNAKNLDVNGALTTDGASIFLQTANGGNIEIRAGGSLSTLDSGTGALGDLTLESAGAIKQDSDAGAITADTLEGYANGEVTLANAANQIADLGGKLGFNAGAGNTVVLDDDVSSFGLLNIDGTITAGTLDLVVAHGGISEMSAGVIDAGALEGSAQGDIILTNEENQIADIGGKVGLSAGAGEIDLNDDVSGAGQLSIDGLVTAATFDLNVTGGGIAEKGAGVIDAATLEGSAEGDVTLGNKANQIADLGSKLGFSVGGGNTILLNDDVSNSGGLTIDGAVTAGTLDINTTGGGFEEAGVGVIDASVLEGSAQGDVTLASTSNQIADIGGSVGFNAGANTVTLNDDVSASGQLTIDGTVTAATLDFAVANGGIDETSTGLIDAGTLEGSAQGAVSLGGSTAPIGNKIDNLGGSLGFDTDGNAFSLTNAKNLDVNGAITTDGKSIFIQTANGSIEIAAGGSLSTLDTSSGALGDLTLESAGTIKQDGGAGAITANTLDGYANGDVTLANGANQIADLGGELGFSAGTGNAIDINDDVSTFGQLTVDGTVTTGTLDLNVTGGGIAEKGAGVIDAGTLEGSAQGDVSFGSSAAPIANKIDNLGGVLGFDTDGFNLSLTDANTLDVNGAVTTDGESMFLQTANGGNIDIVAGGSLSTSNGAGPLGDLTLESAGTIKQDSDAGAITANTLDGYANGDVTLTNSANQIADLGAKLGFSAGTGNTIILDDNVASFGQLTIDGTITAGTLNFAVTNGGIKETSTGLIDANTLGGSAQGDVKLGSANQVAKLSGFTTDGGGFLITDNSALNIDGVVDTTNKGNAPAADIKVTADGITFDSGGLIGDTVTLNSGRAINESHGAITATTLTGSSIGQANFASSSNNIVDLSDFTTDGGKFFLTDNIGLNIDGAVDTTNAGAVPAANITVTADGVVFDVGGTLVGDRIALHSGSAIDESHGAITASTLTGTSIGEANFASNKNSIGNLAGFTTGGGEFLLTDNAAVNVDGLVDTTNAGADPAANITLTADGIAFDAGGAGGLIGNTVALYSGSAIDESHGAITASTLTGTSIGEANFASNKNSVANLAGFTTGGGKFLLTDNAALNVDGLVDTTNAGADPAANITLTADGIAFDAGGAGALVGDTVTLDSGSTIDESHGAITASTLTGTSIGEANFASGKNSIANLAGFSTGGAEFLLMDNAALNVDGLVDTTNAGADPAANITLGADGIAFDAGGAGALVGDTVTLDSGSTIDESHGAIAASTLTGSSDGEANFSSSNNKVADLSGFTTGGGGFSLTDGQTLTVDGVVLTGGGAVSLSTEKGDVDVEDGGEINTQGKSNTFGDVTLDSAGSITLVGESNATTKTPPLIDSGSLTLVAGGNIFIGDSRFISFVDGLSHTSAANINEDLNHPNIFPNQSGGYDFISTGTLTVRANGRVLSENTGGNAQTPKGISVSGGPTAVTVGGATPNGEPAVVDLFIDPGNVVFKAYATDVVLAPGTHPNANYRVDGCEIEGTGACTIVTYVFNNLSPQQLVDPVVIKGADDVQQDPTITIDGNEEIWENQ